MKYLFLARVCQKPKLQLRIVESSVDESSLQRAAITSVDSNVPDARPLSRSERFPVLPGLISRILFPA